MDKKFLTPLAGLCLVALAVSGCTVRTYNVTRDRVDQDLTTGNHGYILGTPAAIDTTNRKLTRETSVVEVELGKTNVKSKGTTCKREAKPVAKSTCKRVQAQPAVEEPVKFPCPSVDAAAAAPTQNFGPATNAQPEPVAVPVEEPVVKAVPVNKPVAAKPVALTCPVASEQKMEKYTVQKGDTLQKISQKYFGTTKKWTQIYDANKDVLKGPNKIYPGQVINIPVEGMKEPAGNLK